MHRPIDIIEQLDTHAFDEVVDVRTASEYEEDHVPGAINLPVLNERERAEVGTLYKQQDPFTARKRGSALVARNIAAMVEGHFADRARSYRPLIYCWRGGQRSGSVALVLSQIGWRPAVIKGGYKRYRSHVLTTLVELAPRLPLVTLAGLTGTAKTRILGLLEQAGSQVLDLEGLAHHRGSLLGGDPERPQPSQKRFDGGIAQLINQLHERSPPSAAVWIESESSKIGNLFCPPALWQRMKGAPVVEISAPLSARAEFLIEHYRHFLEQPQRLRTQLRRLTERHGKARINAWEALIMAGRWRELVCELLEQHYDPSYRLSMARNSARIQQRIELPDLSERTLRDLVEELRQIELRVANSC